MSLTIEILLTAYPLFNSIIIVIQCKNFINQFIFLTSLKLPSQIKRSHTSRNLALIWYMISRWRGSIDSSMCTGHLSIASGSIVWLVYAHVAFVISNA